MKFRTGVAAGGVIGFLIGVEVGHRRYHEVQEFLDRLGRKEPIRSVAGVGQDFIDGTTDGVNEYLGERMEDASRVLRESASG
ncbi:MAG: hypothetical protein ACE5MI_12855 [Acidimicrobiia bacterium]